MSGPGRAPETDAPTDRSRAAAPAPARRAPSRAALPDVATALRRELARKALHVSTAAVPVAYALGVPRRVLLPALLALLAIALGVEALRRWHGASREWFVRLTGALLREHEHAGLAGATWLLVAFAASVAIAAPPLAIAALWAVAVGDAAAAVVGRAVQARRARRATAAGAPPPAGKSWAGSAACAAATWLGALALARLTWDVAALVAVAAALAERPVLALDDNLRVAGAVLVVGMLAGG